MADQFAAKLNKLGFRLPNWCYPPTEGLVAAFEQRFSVILPQDYREFLVAHGGVCLGSGLCPFQEPTPCGPETVIDGFLGFSSPERGDNINQATMIVNLAPSVVAIGDNLIGGMFWLKLDGSDAGYVYLHDPEGRSAWSDEQFSERFPNLAPQVKEYLNMRRRGALA